MQVTEILMIMVLN